RLVEGRRVEHAVDVREMMRDPGAPAAGREPDRLGQLGLVLRQPLDLPVRREALHEHVDGLAQALDPGSVHHAEVFQLPPVVLLPRQAFLLDRAQDFRAAHHADARVLRAVDAENERGHGSLRGTESAPARGVPGRSVYTTTPALRATPPRRGGESI